MKSKSFIIKVAPLVLAIGGAVFASQAQAVLLVQCPGDDGSRGGVAGDAIVDSKKPAYSNINCVHLAATDGYINMADGESQYMFSYKEVTGLTVDQIPNSAQLKAESPAPTIIGKEGQDLYLTLSNVGLALRPDLPDAHTIHYHGYPNAAAIMDGVPDVSISPNSFASMTYYYHLVDPGTYIYHCHFEATEHMQMGMIGNLWVEPKQNETRVGDPVAPNSAFIHQAGYKYVYNDGDGSTQYDVEKPLQIIGFDREFHNASEQIAKLPFAAMGDDYPMINGRGYPDTVNTDTTSQDLINMEGNNAQPMDALITATAGQKILLRLSNVSIVNSYTLTAPGLTMKLVGRGARIYRSTSGKELFQESSQVTLSGGDVFEVIIDTTGVQPGTYFLYTTNLNFLSNNQEDNGGVMTEIHIEAGV